MMAVFIIQNKNEGWNEFLKDVKIPLDKAMAYLKEGNVDDARKKINYAITNIGNYTETMGSETLSDFKWRINTLNGLMGVSPKDIDIAYQLVTEQMRIEQLSENLTKNVKATLNDVESDARIGGNKTIISATEAYKEAIHATIGNTSEILIAIDNELKSLGYVESE
ncbi:hypothetical protein GQ473_01225 [archaeon]|nr:hypothetical protein [archaeon]